MRIAALVLAASVLSSCIAISDTTVANAPAETREDAAQLVAARQAGMRMMVMTLSSVGRTAEAPDTPLARAGFAIGGLEKFADAMPALFSEHTSSVDGTKSLPQVWTDKAGFDGRIAQFRNATGALGKAAAANDRSGFAEALASTKAACEACHDQYRAEDK